MLGSQFTQNNFAAAPQTWTRSGIGARILFVNDTVRTAGDRNELSFANKKYPLVVDGSKLTMAQLNFIWEYELAAELHPFRVSTTILLPDSLQNSVATARTRWQDFHTWVAGQLFGTNTKVDDLMAHRLHLP
jgi:hypothetical protein